MQYENKYTNEREDFHKRFLSQQNDSMIGFRVPKQLKELFDNLLTKLNKKKSEQLMSLVIDFVFNNCELLELFEQNQNQKSKLKARARAVNIVESYKRDLTVSLPAELVKFRTENSVLIERVSNVLSLNKTNEAYKFAMGLLNLVDNLPANSEIIFTETDDKGNISTKLTRNLFGTAIIFILIGAMDKGHTIHTMKRTKKPVFVEDLILLLAEGLSRSIEERTEVYDNLFFEKYSKSHYNQWLQWSFGLSRRIPLDEFNRLLMKNSKIAKPIGDDFEDNEIEIRTEKAIENLKGRYTLFGLSEEGLELAISKIREFSRLYSEYSYDYVPKCKSERWHTQLGKGKSCLDCKYVG